MGYGIMVARKGGKVVVIKGNPAVPVNRGFNRIEGYLSAKIIYGENHLVMPLPCANSKGKFDKESKFQQVS